MGQGMIPKSLDNRCEMCVAMFERLKSLLSPLRRRLSAIKLDCRVLFARLWHWRVRNRIRAKARRGEKIRVVFLESEVAKWKTQSLFDLMKDDPHYEPVMAIFRRDRSTSDPEEKVLADIQAAKAYFEAKGNPCEIVYSSGNPFVPQLKRLNPDIVFYQQSWVSDGIEDVCRYALPAYVPYYVVNYGEPEIGCKMTFHRFLAYYFHLNSDWAEIARGCAPAWFYSGRHVATGHPSLDYLHRDAPPPPKRPCVIYAPHFSFILPNHDNLLGISTFPWIGRPILDYAKAHPNLNWVFRPHLVLRRELVDSGLMTVGERDRYFAEWGRIARVSTDSDYQGLFAESTAMVTDCGSFLCEYGATGKPLIHLISSTAKVRPMKPAQELFATFYEAHDLDEAFAVFKTVLEDGEDPKEEIRQKAVAAYNLAGVFAAGNIMRCFEQDLLR